VGRGSWVGVVVTSGVLLLTAGCAEEGPPSPAVLVDYEHDEFATQFIRYFPDRLQAHPGDTITFRQAWTGEPHTVALGTLVDEVLSTTRPLLEEYGHLPDEEIPEEVFTAYFEAEGKLPTFYQPPEGEQEQEGEGGQAPESEGDDAAEGASSDPVSDFSQAMAQACVIAAGGSVPDDGGPCEDQRLEPFEGTEAYYNSGIIPYDGPSGNVYELELSEDIAPGEYAFYCAVHGSMHSGVLEVVGPDDPVPTPREISSQVREEVTTMIRPYREAFDDAADESYAFQGTAYPWNYAGLLSDITSPNPGLINEFVPDHIETRVGEPVTWRLFGPHTISFDVPEYFPIVEFDEDGTVRSNEALYPPAGGAPDLPDIDELEDPRAPLAIDGGTYDGDGFWSSGVVYGEGNVEYTVRVSEPGEYRFACLIHPPMVGTLTVTE
jgi:plastocyanin